MERSKFIYILLVLCILFFAGVQSSFSQKKKSAEKRIAQMEVEVKELSSKVRILEARIASLEVINAFPSTEKLRQGMIQANRDAMINDLNNLAANAYQYKIRPTTMGGGGGSYSNFTIPSRIAINDNGSYILRAVAPDSVVFMATSQINLGTVTCILDNTGRLHGFEYTGEFK